MDHAANTLFELFQDGKFPPGPLLFSGARVHPALDKSLFTLVQPFRPHARELEERGFTVFPEFPGGAKNFTAGLALLPKNALEARYETAKTLDMLGEGGMLACAAPNDAGGRRIVKILEEFGLARIRKISGNKSVAALGFKNGMNDSACAALAAGELQDIPATGFLSRPGLFAWDKIDTGSEILSRHLPQDLNGRGADFGCGYGFLSRFMAEKYPGITHLSCIDADYRALKACRENLKNVMSFETDFLWEDLTMAISLKNLDFIIMNPPFHEGKKTDSDIGAAFIITAAASLKPGGELWMVANANLPYERMLDREFSWNEKIAQDKGFKILRAVK